MVSKFTRSRLVRAVATFSVVVALASSSFAQKICMTAVLDGAQEVPPTPSAAKGTAVVIVDRDLNTLTYHLVWDGATSAEVAAHIHGFSPPGVNSGIKFALALGKYKTGVVVYAEADEANILAGNSYFNVHTATFGGGEIRGQILRSSAPVTMFAVSTGAQEVPPTPSAGTGVGFFKFDTVANTITYSHTYHGLTSAEVAAHFHGFSAPGANSGVKINLPLGFHKSGTVAYVPTDEINYLAGLAYINVHTTTFGGGEIRGQFTAGSSNPTTYCNGKVNSQGCLPQASFTGLPTLTGADDFHVTCTQVINNKAGLMYWGLNPKNAPFLGGTQCVASPVRRTPIQNSAGNAPPDDCSGVFDFHFSDAYMALSGLTVGSTIFCEYWYRDPSSSFTVGLSNAVYGEILP